MNKKYQNVNNLKVSDELLSFVNDELLKETSISPEKFWQGFDNIVHELSPLNKKLIEKREILQKKIDDWHIKNRGAEIKSSNNCYNNWRRWFWRGNCFSIF